MTNENLTRRSFYIAVTNMLGGLIAAAAAIPAAFYLITKPRKPVGKEWIEVADISGLQMGVPEEIVYNRERVDGWRKIDEKTSTWVVRTSQDTVVAYTPACTHLGCAYHWDNTMKQFECPCHGSSFSIDGKVTAGPAPRPLDQYATRIEDQKILIGPEIKEDA
ncbi:MAG: ubiquinol-cytochrome c reductase iron-sulfur subunit [Bryobacterales bacterium]|nr:ubiquinol-cytochrome c reductase iron-sulfur subunit [Bryobacterales bacterium]MBV9399981.1 ubiquinol-cytochrome c reductase iron-sulfur subunit [Bryobacterales bacterium]